MAYIKERISNFGTQFTYLTTLRDFFVGNGVAPFELVKDLSEEDLSFTVERNKLRLNFSIKTTTSAYVSIEIFSKVSSDTYSNAVTHTVEYCQSESSSVTIGRELQVFLIKNEDTVLIQIAPWNAVSVSKGVIILDCLLSNGTNLIGSSGHNSSITTVSLKETTTQNTYIVRPFHTGSNDETSIILSNTLAVNTSSGVYFADVNGLKSAGGAKQFGYYVTNSDTYYGVFADVAIPLGDRVEYVANE
jgi:hypothetical protein